ncbi:hypothetical protein JI752_002350 [Lysobacter sp. MMG2]|uniref:hypothetical protein n=1 Tax=Lysobacter sp. MMG2 TaxID=2801338 RepID=UPI001C24621C|nr:hypothetical protein [Lysobacter sp. MMG2]MBU8974972.1 hypothetical protein [Lysobacter sp. MMG2]
MAAVRWILLIWLGTVVLSTFLVSWVVLWHRLALQREAWRLQSAFDALSFDTPQGPVCGDALTVVKIAYQLDNHAASPRAPVGYEEPWDSLWYAAGPGPSYFVAICSTDVRDHAPHWCVRALDEPRMRAAISGDRQAEMLAFGEAIEA